MGVYFTLWKTYCAVRKVVMGRVIEYKDGKRYIKDLKMG